VSAAVARAGFRATSSRCTGGAARFQNTPREWPGRAAARSSSQRFAGPRVLPQREARGQSRARDSLHQAVEIPRAAGPPVADGRQARCGGSAEASAKLKSQAASLRRGCPAGCERGPRPAGRFDSAARSRGTSRLGPRRAAWRGPSQ
jgi:hypothetical protein